MGCLWCSPGHLPGRNRLPESAGELICGDHATEHHVNSAVCLLLVEDVSEASSCLNICPSEEKGGSGG